MMYNQKLVASIKANGKILREFKDTVYVPFSSEYSILLKNLNTVRAVVDIFVDGKNVVDSGLVIAAGQQIDLERSILNGNLKEGNRFKFIERTDNIEKHRGIGLEDGIVRIEYKFEQPQIIQPMVWNSSGYPGVPASYSSTAISTSAIKRSTRGGQSISSNSAYMNNVNVSATSFNDAGITVAGSKSDQKFQTASWFPTEPIKHSIVLKLLGETPDNKPVFNAVTVKAKPKCVTCGKQNKATAKFCTECGTALEIFA